MIILWKKKASAIVMAMLFVLLKYVLDISVMSSEFDFLTNASYMRLGQFDALY